MGQRSRAGLRFFAGRLRPHRESRRKAGLPFLGLDLLDLGLGEPMKSGFVTCWLLGRSEEREGSRLFWEGC